MSYDHDNPGERREAVYRLAEAIEGIQEDMGIPDEHMAALTRAFGSMSIGSTPVTTDRVKSMEEWKNDE